MKSKNDRIKKNEKNKNHSFKLKKVSDRFSHFDWFSALISWFSHSNYTFKRNNHDKM